MNKRHAHLKYIQMVRGIQKANELGVKPTLIYRERFPSIYTSLNDEEVEIEYNNHKNWYVNNCKSSKLKNFLFGGSDLRELGKMLHFHDFEPHKIRNILNILRGY